MDDGQIIEIIIFLFTHELLFRFFLYLNLENIQSKYRLTEHAHTHTYTYTYTTTLTNI